MPTPAATSDVTIFNSHDPVDYKHCRCGLYWDVCLLGQWPSKDRITLWHKASIDPAAAHLGRDPLGSGLVMFT
jgi:hypothetical protein